VGTFLYSAGLPAKANDDNGLVLAPSQQFIASLPLGKRPKRENVKPLESEARIASWQQSGQQSEQQSQVLADEFADMLASGSIMDRIDRIERLSRLSLLWLVFLKYSRIELGLLREGLLREGLFKRGLLK